MTLTLRGRMETRLFLLALVGLAWTAVVTPVLPRPSGMSLSTCYRVTYETLGLVAGIGLVWELLYHGLQQYRWDKDWPSLFGLLNFVNEGLLLWFVLHWTGVVPGTLGTSSVLLSLFLIHFVSTWLAMWLFMQGPLRVVHLRWRYQGGRIF